MNKSGLICKILIRRSACPSYKCFPAETAPLAQLQYVKLRTAFTAPRQRNSRESALQLLQPFFGLLLGLAAVITCVAAAGRFANRAKKAEQFVLPFHYFLPHRHKYFSPNSSGGYSRSLNSLKRTHHKIMHIGIIHLITCDQQAIENRSVNEIDAYVNIKILS